MDAQEQFSRCYVCGISVRRYSLAPGEESPPDALTSDHVPPKGLFVAPRPANLLTVPCCFACNNQHSGFDERLRIAASLPFDRNEAGKSILDNAVIGGTLKKGRQMRFTENIIKSMEVVPDQPNLIRASIDAQGFREGIIRITKGLLYALHPTFDYSRSKFFAIDIAQRSNLPQLQLMAALKYKGIEFTRGLGVFQSWRMVDEAGGTGQWMLIFYDCFGFFVAHTNGHGLDQFADPDVRQ